MHLGPCRCFVVPLPTLLFFALFFLCTIVFTKGSIIMLWILLLWILSASSIHKQIRYAYMNNPHSYKKQLTLFS